MRPFFSYYGAKWTMAKHYGAPRRGLVIEPFAGSACYATRWAPTQAALYDISPNICDLWDFLIHGSERDIARIPDSFDHIDQVCALPRGARLLVSFWVSKGRAEPSNVLSPWYFRYRNDYDCRVWGPSVKQRIIAQKPLIARWSVDCLSWDKIPLREAHWHVDPPYANSAGRRYPFGDVEYAQLAEWCRALPGHVDVCENVGAAWLPFRPLHPVVTLRGRRSGAVSHEAVWSCENV
jgi:site-specific DNA-adenine methylase